MTSGDNGLGTLQSWVSAVQTELSQTWLATSSTGPGAVITDAAFGLGQAAGLFSGAAAQQSYSPPTDHYTEIRQLAISTVGRAAADVNMLPNASPNLNSFAQTATQWINSAAPTPTLTYHTDGGISSPPSVPQAGPLVGGPLTSCLIGVLTTLYRSLNETNTALDLINNAPPVQPAGQDLATELLNTLTRLGNLLGTAAMYCANVGTTIHAAAADHATTLNDTLTTISSLAAQLTTSAIPPHPDTLASILNTVNSIRAIIWPSPESSVEVGAKFAYYELTQWLSYALQIALSAATPASAAPAALFPFRLETRLTPKDCGVTLQVRIFPDDIVIDSHDPALTADEVTAAATLQGATRVGQPAPREIAAAAWAQTAAAFGPGRTAYLNLVQLPGQPPPSDTTAAQPTPTLGREIWPEPAQCQLLPDRWLVVVYGFEEQIPLAAALSGPVRRPLQLGPDLRPAVATAGSLGVETGLEWLVDYQSALAAGMAVTLTLDGLGGQPISALGVHPGDVPIVGKVVVVGLQTPTTGDEPSNLLTQTLLAHRFTDGLEILAPGTQTNNVTGTPSAYHATDPAYADSFAREVAIPQSWTPPYAVTGDASRLAGALSIPTATFAGAGPPRTDALDAQAMAAITWHAGGGVILPWLGITDPAVIDAARLWTSAFVTPSGPLPAIRVGTQPYGVLPVTSYRPTAPDLDPISRAVARAISIMLPVWKTAGTTALREDMMWQLQRTPIATAFAAGLAVANDPTVTVHSSPSWLPPNRGLMTFTPDDVEASVETTTPFSASIVAGWLTGGGPPPNLPSQLGLFSSEGSPQLAWPVGGSAQATPGAQQAFLTSLLTTGPVTPPAMAEPDTLLTALANHAWVNTAGVTGAADTPLQQAGLLPAGQQPQPPASAADDLRAATRYLAGSSDTDLDAITGGAIDVVSHRLDAWATALATARLARIRLAGTVAAPSLVVGGYGVVENLLLSAPLENAGLADDATVLVDPSNDGYLSAPSLTQAVTAAVLRSGYLNHAPVPRTDRNTDNAAFAVDLSSRRARTAQWLLAGMRQGQPLGALLGYRFERRLVQDGQGALVAWFRQRAPLDPASNQDPTVDVTAEPPASLTARATDVVDGVTLHALWQVQQTSAPTTNHFTEAATQPAFRELDDALDAVTDAVTATAVHQTITGDTTAAAATMDGVMHGTVTVDPTAVLGTPRTGTAVIQRIILPAAATALPTGWAGTPTSQAEPALSSWVASLLPAPSTMTVLSGRYTSESGTSLPDLAPVTIDQLNIGPLDFLRLAQRPNELRQLAAHYALTQPGLPSDTAVQPDEPASGSGSYGQALDIAVCLSTALGSGRPADARDLSGATGPPMSPGVDQANLDARVTAATDALNAALAACAAALPGVPAPGSGAPPTQLPTSAGADLMAAALKASLLLGVPGTAPATGPDTLDLWASQVYSAWTTLISRQTASAKAAAIESDASEAQLLEAALAQLAAIFGKQFPVIPPVAALTKVLTQTPTGLSGMPAGQDPLSWLVKASKTRPPIAALLTAVTGAEASNAGTVELSVSVAQDPPGNPWAGGGPLPEGADVSALAGTLCLTSIGTATQSDDTIAAADGALVLADWTEAIPSVQETAGITYQFNAPAAQALQAILLAVNADPHATTWAWSDLTSSVTDTVDLAYCRAVGSTDVIDGSDLLRPALYVQAEPSTTPPIRAAFQPGYMAFTPQATITALTATPGPLPSLQQGQTATFPVTGTTLKDITANDISVVGPPLTWLDSAFKSGVTIVTYTADPTTPDTNGTLTLTASLDATPSGRALVAGHGDSSPVLFMIGPRPQAVWCNTTLIHQTISPQTIAVAVHGDGLAAANATVSGGENVVTNTTIITASDNVLTVALTIAECTYKPLIPGRLGLPFPNPAPPKHVAVNIALVVTPTGPGAEPTHFNIAIDTLE